MPTLELGDYKIDLGDTFMTLSPEQQHATVDEIAKTLPAGGASFHSPEFDAAIAQKYGATPEHVRGLKESMAATAGLEGIPIAGGFVEKAGSYIPAINPWGQGASGGSISERAAHNQELEQELMQAYRQAHPVESRVAPIVGGGVALGGAGMTTAGANALGLVGGSLMRQMGAGALSGGVIGGTDAAVRGGDIGIGAGLGAALGGVAPAVVSGIRTLAAPIVSNIRARLNPQGAGERQVARAVIESQQTPQQIEAAIQQARAEGQGSVFTPADAMGNAGQRMLSNVVRAPGEGRTEAVNFLEARQAEQGRRIAGDLAEGFEAPETAQQTVERLTKERAENAAQNYGMARGQAGSVDVTPAIRRIDDFLQPGVTRVANPQSEIANDSIEALMQRARNMLADQRGSQVTRFDEAFRVKQELDNMIDNARPTAQRVLIPVRNALDDQLAAASGPYAAARDRFRQQSQAIEAVAEGRQAATRGRFENTVPAFQQLGKQPRGSAAALPPVQGPPAPYVQRGVVAQRMRAAQGLPPGAPVITYRPPRAPPPPNTTEEAREAWRSGYVDPLIEQVQGAPVGINKARQFTSDAFGREAQAMAPEADLMMRRLGRENTMFETRRQAMGGSQTADNLADAAAMGVDPSMIGHVLTGNFAGALRSAMGAISNGITGNTPAVRRAVGQILLSRNLPPGEFQQMLDRTIASIVQVQRTAQTSGRTLAGIMSMGANQATTPSPPPPASPLARVIAAPRPSGP